MPFEAIRKGQIAAYGSVHENQKLNIALMDYTAQITTRMKDPGLLRILFHRGTTTDKMVCFIFKVTLYWNCSAMEKRKCFLSLFTML